MPLLLAVLVGVGVAVVVRGYGRVASVAAGAVVTRDVPAAEVEAMLGDFVGLE